MMMNGDMELYAHQQRVIDLNPPKYLLASGTGTGKTITALALAAHNNLEVLVVCPKQVRKKWERTMEEMFVVGTVIGRDRFRIDHKKIRTYQAIIWDECHIGIGNMKSQMHKAFMWYVTKHDVYFRWLLSGTPYSSGPLNIYSIARALGHNWNYLTFRDRFFVPRYFGNRMIWEPRKGIEEEVALLIRRIGDVTRLEECFDVPDQILDVEYFEQSLEQRKAIKEMQTQESNPAVRFVKLHQIASGTLKGNEFEEGKTYACDKNDRIVTYAEENKKLIVFSRYNAHLILLSQMLHEKKIPHAIINGDVDDKEIIFAHAEASDRFVLLINAQVAEGYELPSFSVMLFASLSFSYVAYTQAMYRILRANALKKNVYKILLTEGTPDERVYASIKNKEDFSLAIYAKEETTIGVPQDVSSWETL